MQLSLRAHYFVIKTLLIAVIVFSMESKIPAQAEDKNISIDTAVSMALRNSDEINLKLQELKNKQYSILEAKSSLYPSIKLETVSSYITNPPEGVTIKEGEFGYAPSPNSQFPVPFPDRDYTLINDTENTYFKITATLTQALFTWGKISKNIEITTLDRDLKYLELVKKRREIAYQVKRNYALAVLFRENIKLLKQSKKVIDEILKDREDSYREGLINLADLLTVRSNVALTDESLVEASENYRSAVEALKILTGINSSQINLISNFKPGKPRLHEKNLAEYTLKKSPDIEILKKKIDQAEKYLSIERAGSMLKPDISLIVTLNITGQRIPVIGANWTDSWDTNLVIGIGTKTNIFDSGRTKYKIEEASGILSQAETAFENYKKLIKLNIRQTVQNIRTNYYRTLSKEASLKQAEETEKNAEISFKNSLITREKLGNAKLLLYRLEMERNASLYDYLESLITLEKITGKNESAFYN